MANGGGAGGLARGIQFGLQMREAQAERQQREQAVRDEALRQRGTQINERITQAFETVQTIVQNADQRGIPRDSPRVERTIRPILDQALQLSQDGQRLGIATASPDEVRARSRALLGLTPTPEDERRQAEATTRAEARARAQGQAEGTPLSVESQFGAVDTITDERFTVLRTNRGLFRQRVGEDGRVTFEPVDSSRVRPVATQEAGTPMELGLGSTEQRHLNDAEVAARNFVATTGDALRLLQENPDVNTWAGQAAGLVNNLQQEGRAIARALGTDFEEDIFDVGNYEDTFVRLGIDNARMQSLITSLAFQAAAASGQTGRSVSDRDVRRFIREVGANAADPTAFARVLRDVADRTVRNFRTNFRVRTGEPYRGDLGMSTLPAFEEEGEGGGRAGALPEGIPEGSRLIGRTGAGLPVYETPGGERLVVEPDPEIERLLDKYAPSE